VASGGRARLAAIGVVIAAVGGVTGIVYAAEGTQGEGAGGFFDQLKAKFEAHKNKILNIDDNKKVLPDPHPPPYGKPITVVLSDDVLLVQEYQPMSGGMLTKKRPGVEFFLAQLSQDYELVIWSLQPVQSFGPVIEKLDPNHHALHRLFVDATVVSEGATNVKDLKLLNRPLDKTIIVDVKSENVVQKENLIVAPKYEGALEDVYLLELLNFFRLLAASSKSQNGVPDVRVWVAALQKHGVKYFKDKYAEAVRKAKERAEEEKRKREEQLQMRDVAGAGSGRKW
jgi:import inner membrane translocase subunit TIM50